MLVHFGASTEHLEDRMVTYRAIRDVIKDNGHELARDWLEEAYSHRNASYNYDEIAEIARLTRAAIASSDLVILEVTDQSFGIGYQAALATSLQKPLLIIHRADSRTLGAIGTGAGSSLHSRWTYNSESELKTLIKKFIDKNNISTKDLRFNMMLERDLFYYLTNESEYTGMSKSQIVRNLIREAANNKRESDKKG